MVQRPAPRRRAPFSGHADGHRGNHGVQEAERRGTYRHPAAAATVAAAFTGAEEGTRSAEPLDERAARVAMAKACPGGVGEEQTPSVEWDGHGSRGGTDRGEWETRINPGDAVAFAIEQGGKLRVIGPGEVADITLASRASVVIALPWTEGGQGAARDVRAWVRVEVDGIVRGAWTSLARTAMRTPGGGVDSTEEGGTEPGVDDPGRTPADSGSAVPPPAETGAGGFGRCVSDGLRRIEGPESSGAGDGDEEVAVDCRAAAALLLRPWTQGEEGTGAIAALARWILAHVSNHLARGRGRPVSWQWRLMTVAWVMLQCGIHTLISSNRQEALAHIEALGFFAAASRALPFVGWATGRATTVPGVKIPGMRHRNPLIFDTAIAHRGGAAERLLERVVRNIEDSNGGSRARREPDGGQDDGEPGDVDMGGSTAAREGSGVTATAGRRRSVRGLSGRTGEDQKDDRAGRPNGDDDPGYAGGAGGSAPCEPPYSGMPTGAAQSGELRGDLQRGPGASLGRKRGSSPAAEREVELRAVKRCLDDGPEWSARGDDRGPNKRAGRVYLLSLFDAVGTTMLAMVELFAAMGCQDRFAGGWFAEAEDHLASPLAKHWAARSRQGGLYFDRVGGDLYWDLLRNRGRTLAGMLAEIEPGAMLIIIGESPCQQLILAGRHGGREGLCGDDSWNFYVFPLILHVARRARPDIDVHVTVENAGSMMAKFKVAIARAPGISIRDASAGAGPCGLELDAGGEFAPVIDARRFSPYTRKRIFFSTPPPAKDRWTIRGGRPSPWDDGWERRSPSGLGPLRDMPPMMRGRGHYPGIRPSAYQFHPDFLLYSGNMLNIAHYRIIPAITSAMPPHVREGFRGIMASRGPTGSGARDPDRERKADAAAQ